VTGAITMQRTTTFGAALLTVLSLPIAASAHRESRRETVTYADAQPIP
jgi:hypothetical protein